VYVIKLGGREGNDDGNVVADLRGLGSFVLVHGGSSAVDALGAAMGHPARYVTSPEGFVSRYTDAVAVDLVVMAMAGQINVRLVSRLQASGVPAVGLSGVDGRLLVGRRKSALRIRDQGKVKIIRDDRSGIVESVNTSLLRTLMEAGYVPVVSPPILEPDTGLPLNADADRIAAKIAVAMRADALVLLTNVPGLLRDPSEPRSLVPRLSRDEIPAAIVAAEGGMKKKLLASREALEGGVPFVVIADSRVRDPVRSALQGHGTVIT